MSSLYNNNEVEAEAESDDDDDDDYVYSPSSTKSSESRSSPSESFSEKQQQQHHHHHQNRHDSKSLYEKLQILLSKNENELSSSNQTTMTTRTMEFHGERCLVGWILLTRLDQDDLDCAWLKYSTILISFAKQLLLIQQQKQKQNLHKKQTTEENLLLISYIRLISQVTSRLSVYPNEIGEILFQTWIDCCENNNEKSSSSILFILPWRKVHIDVLTSLDVWMMELSDPIKINELRILERIWNSYVQISSKATAAAATTTTDSSDEDNNNSEKDDDDESKMLSQTLLAILGDDDNDDYYSMKSWHDLVLAIFQSHGHKLMSDSLLPVILCTNIPALTSSSSSSEEEESYNNNNNNYYQNAWHEWIFSLIQARVTTINLSSNNTVTTTPMITANNPTLANFDGDGNNQTQTSATTLTFLKDPKAIHNLNKMLLAHAVAPTITTTKTSSEKISLREMAWQTLTAIGENCGWRWSLMEDKNNSSSTLGNGTTICTWVRLASGELNIQLQQELLLLSASSPPSSSPLSTTSSNIDNVTTMTNSTQQQQQQQASTSSPSSLILPISHSCARVLMSVVQFCVQLEEEPHRMPLSSDSLLHLRQSLEQSLWTLVEYLQLRSQSQFQQQQKQQNNNKEEGGPMSSSSSLLLFLPIAIRLFGALLMEVDIWDLLRPQQEESGHPKEILNALIQTLPMEDLASSNYSLLPGLVNIIGDAESNDEKQQQLISIWDPLFEYLIRYWKDHKHIIMDDDSIAWACACTELWSDHHPANVSISSGGDNDDDDDDDYDEKKKRRLIVLLIDWIQTALQRIGSNPGIIGSTMPIPPSLSLVLGCYMVLCKDRSQPPKQHESRVIVRALQLCEQAQ